MGRVWGIILAAGASTRMKKQKMLLPFNGKTIIETVVENVSMVLQNNVIVILGSHKNEINALIEKTKVKTAINLHYEMGMLSSVICGLKMLPENTGAMMVFLGDQPQLPHQIIEKVKMAWENSSKGIVIPAINGRRGHPILIGRKYFTEIESLNPDKGLRELAAIHANDVLEVDCHFPEILRDIDTPEDYKYETNKLKQLWKK